MAFIVKKSLLALSVASMALTLMANPSQKLDAHSGIQLADRSQMKGLGSIVLEQEPSLSMERRRIASSERSGYAPEDIISSVDGDVQEVTVCGTGYYMDQGLFLSAFEDDRVASHIVYGEGNEVYFFNLIPNCAADSYLKGVREGDKVIIDLPQTIYWFDNGKDGFFAGIFDMEQRLDENGEPMLSETGEPICTYVPSEDSTLTLTIKEDGSMKAEGLNYRRMLAAGLCSTEQWGGYGAWDIEVIPFDEKIVEVPSDMEVADKYWAYSQEGLGYGYFLNFAKGDEEIYLQGLSEYMPEAWIKASVEYDLDNGQALLSIPQDQYLGIYLDSYYIYSKAVKITYNGNGEAAYQLMPDDYQYQLIWDLDRNVITPKDPDITLMYNAAKDRVYYLEAFYDFELVHRESLDGVPANPYNLVYVDYFETYDEAELYFFVPGLSVEGDVLLTENLSYVIYLDDDEWTFSSEDGYVGIDEDMTEIPWAFTSYDIRRWGSTQRQVAFFVHGISTLGVQSIYRCGDKETRSDIVTISVDSDSVDSLADGRGVVNVEFYDLSGHRIATPSQGVFVKRVTFEDGSVRTSKIVR